MRDVCQLTPLDKFDFASIFLFSGALVKHRAPARLIIVLNTGAAVNFRGAWLVLRGLYMLWAIAWCAPILLPIIAVT